ncbi:EamA family transporter [Photobacterium ganghwense]|uniref:Membrane protein n=1 Tax=Photobacterium ganghwense TaxID=320778 RepID=A0A0J1H8X2_9GAMM|nr:EamA family transporter [Photobacterium ganghwense]KLV08096.1 membrane protein [Photobacterium ganghwense]PSU07216.1 EamA family transporter [Photobacterium ganghwense]QSV15968.1 EamA family transporter [Photobacterium ganghwense]
MTVYPTTASSARYGIWAILLASLLWGTTGTVASFAPDVSPLAIGAFAMGFGGLIQALSAKTRLVQEIPRLLQQKQRLLIGAVAITVYPLAFYTSMRLAGVAIGTVISIASAPFATAILECLISKKNTLTQRWMISFGLGITGMALLTYAEPATSQLDESSTLKMTGILLGLIAGCAYAVYSWVAKAMIETGIQSSAAMGSLFGLGAIGLLPTLFFTGNQMFASLSNAMVMIYMAVIPMFLGYFLFGYGLRHINASKATLLTLFEPVVAAVFAVTIVGEVIPYQGWFGMVLIILCLTIQTRESPADKHKLSVKSHQ